LVSDDQSKPDPVARLRNRAEKMATTAAALKKIADARSRHFWNVT